LGFQFGQSEVRFKVNILYFTKKKEISAVVGKAYQMLYKKQQLPGQNRHLVWLFILIF